MTATVKYQIATYEGEITVSCDPNEEDEYIIGRAKRRLINRVGSLPFGYESWRVINRE